MSPSAPEQDAAMVLARAWRPLWDPGALPVDPVRIAWAMGLKVYAARLAPGECAVLHVAPGSDPAIYVDKRDPEPTVRLASAHALGHYVARVGAGDTRFRYRDLREQLAATETDPDEVYANQFAVALLIPDEVVPREDAPVRNPALAATRFGVPPEALAMRLDAQRVG